MGWFGFKYYLIKTEKKTKREKKEIGRELVKGILYMVLS